MSVIDDYLVGASEAQRELLEHVREVILDEAPQATEVISYGMPGFRVAVPGKKNGAVIAGFATRTGDGASYYPHSGTVIARFAVKLAGFRTSSGAVQFSVAQPLPDDVIRALVRARLADLG